MRPSPKASRPHRGDLLQVQSGPSVVPADPEARLERMGFRVSRRPDGHWTVTGSSPLPELHFYSRIELGRFLLGKANHYHQWLNWRQHHDRTTPLSG
ncbi:hypothetical protein ACJO2E_15735 [Marinobacter sp. M1N3S26]|uniref:hypothetical protein n=1 Tax=unclassified Marinobacter TaxID=83889 RepID=UPI00387B60D5